MKFGVSDVTFIQYGKSTLFAFQQHPSMTKQMLKNLFGCDAVHLNYFQFLVQLQFSQIPLESFHVGIFQKFPSLVY